MYDNSKDREILRKGLGKNLITDKDREEMRRKLVSGEMVIISDDDLSRPYYPLVPLKKVQDDFLKNDARKWYDHIIIHRKLR